MILLYCAYTIRKRDQNNRFLVKKKEKVVIKKRLKQSVFGPDFTFDSVFVNVFVIAVILSDLYHYNLVKVCNEVLCCRYCVFVRTGT
jgi:hypothetical protein